MKYIKRYLGPLVLVATLYSCSDVPDNISFSKFDVKNPGFVGSLAVIDKLPESFRTVTDADPTQVLYTVKISGDGDQNCRVASFNKLGKPVLGASLVGSTYLGVRKKGNEVLAVVCKKDRIIP